MNYYTNLCTLDIFIALQYCLENFFVGKYRGMESILYGCKNELFIYDWLSLNVNKLSEQWPTPVLQFINNWNKMLLKNIFFNCRHCHCHRCCHHEWIFQDSSLTNGGVIAVGRKGDTYIYLICLIIISSCDNTVQLSWT